MPEHDEFDERLTQRLRAYESRIPDGELPMTQTQSRNRSRSSLAAGGVIAMGALAGVVLALVLLNRPTDEIGDSSPSPSASVEASASTDASAAPSLSAVAIPVASAAPAPSDAGRWSIAPSCSVDSGSATVATSGPGGAVRRSATTRTVPVDGWHSTDGRDCGRTRPALRWRSTDLRPDGRRRMLATSATWPQWQHCATRSVGAECCRYGPPTASNWTLASPWQSPAGSSFISPPAALVSWRSRSSPSPPAVPG